MKLDIANVTKRAEFKLIPEGQHDGVLHAIIELGRHKTGFTMASTEPGGSAIEPEKTFVRFVFEVPDIKRDDGIAEIVSRDLAASASSKSNMFRFINALLTRKGEQLTDEELAVSLSSDSFMKSLLGLPLTLTVKHIIQRHNGMPYHVIENFQALDKRIAAPEPTREPLIFSFEDSTAEAFNKLTFATKKKIMSALNADELNTAIPEAFEEGQRKFSTQAKAIDLLA